jgi:DNA-binding MarR family transcriptional regulator
MDVDAELRKAAHFRASLRRFLRESNAVTAAIGLTPQRFDLLLFVHAAPGNRTTVTSLTKQLQLGQPAVTDLVNRAVEAGLLRRTRDDIDRRRIWLEVTPAGRKLLLASVRTLGGARETLAATLADD